MILVAQANGAFWPFISQPKRIEVRFYAWGLALSSLISSWREAQPAQEILEAGVRAQLVGEPFNP